MRALTLRGLGYAAVKVFYSGGEVDLCWTGRSEEHPHRDEVEVRRCSRLGRCSRPMPGEEAVRVLRLGCWRSAARCGSP
jgi:hypothetical protein